MQALPSNDLFNHNSFAIPAKCERLFALSRTRDLTALSRLDLHQPLMLGAGTNILFREDYPGDVILNQLQGRQVIDTTDKHAYVRIQAGSNWHETVLWALEQQLSGIENLALIPGTAGAAPVQNIGAYGAELSDTLDLVEVWDTQEKQARMFKAAACELSYRNSIFKQQPERYWILNITLKLSRKPRFKLAYAGLKQQLADSGVEQITAVDVVNAICSLRQQKLPDPEVLPNAGSFFKNPLIDEPKLDKLLQKYPDIPHWPQVETNTKISAAWLIEQCGWKGKRLADAGTATNHALVLVNYGQTTGAELWQLAVKIQAAVDQQFGIKLETEPRILP